MMSKGIQQVFLCQNNGWLAFDDVKRRGIFCYYHKGVFDRPLKSGEIRKVPYEKIYLSDFYYGKDDKTKEMRWMLAGKLQKKQYGPSLSMEPSLAPYVSKIISKIYDEISGKPAQESEADEMLRRTGGRY